MQLLHEQRYHLFVCLYANDSKDYINKLGKVFEDATRSNFPVWTNKKVYKLVETSSLLDSLPGMGIK
jgi:hypothetical protein